MILFINSLFLVKYSARFMHYNLLLPPLYIFCATLSILIFKKLEKVVTQSPFIYFSILSLLFVVLYLLILRSIDPLSVNVDRWSAITSFNNKLLSGGYPYLSRTHLNHQVSGFPGLFILSLPFQFLGDIGYLQLFSFLCFSLLVYTLPIKISEKVIILMLLGTSPIFLWEIAVRSELFSNITLFLLLIFACEILRTKKNIINMMLLGSFAGIIFSTRGILLIPVIIYFLKYFKRNEAKYFGVFWSASVFIFLMTFAPFYFWDTNAFIQNNPIFLQSSYIPKFLLFVVLAVSLFWGFKITQFDRFFLYTGYILFVIVSIVIILAISKNGLTQVLYHNGFDISYYQFSMPFLFLSLFKKFGRGINQA